MTSDNIPSPADWAVAKALNDAALADRLRTISRDIRRFSVAQRIAILTTAADRLESRPPAAVVSTPNYDDDFQRGEHG